MTPTERFSLNQAAIRVAANIDSEKASRSTAAGWIEPTIFPVQGDAVEEMRALLELNTMPDPQ